MNVNAAEKTQISTPDGNRTPTRGLILSKGNIFFDTTPRSTLVSSLVLSGYRGLFPRGLSGRGVKLTTYLTVAPILRMRGATSLCHILLHGVIVN
jgi:hypothetical protein